MATLTAVVALAYGLIALLFEIPYAVPAFVAGTTAVTVGMFSGFRASHLREIDRSKG